MIELFLPFSISTNNYYVKTRAGVFISQKGKAYRNDVLNAVNEQLGPLGQTGGNDSMRRPLDGPLHIDVVWFPPDARNRDYDNFVGKSFHDALTHAGLWVDDSLIRSASIYKGEISKPGGYIFLRVSEAGPLFTRELLGGL